MRVSPILLWNSTSIKNKIHELTLFLENYSILIAVLTETWLKPSDSLSIPNYAIVRKYRPLEQGMAILIHNNIPWQTLHQPDLELEYVAVKLLTPLILIVATVYIPPRNPIDPKTLHKLTSLNMFF